MPKLNKFFADKTFSRIRKTSQLNFQRSILTPFSPRSSWGCRKSDFPVRVHLWSESTEAAKKHKCQAKATKGGHLKFKLKFFRCSQFVKRFLKRIEKHKKNKKNVYFLKLCMDIYEDYLKTLDFPMYKKYTKCFLPLAIMFYSNILTSYKLSFYDFFNLFI